MVDFGGHVEAKMEPKSILEPSDCHLGGYVGQLGASWRHLAASRSSELHLRAPRWQTERPGEGRTDAGPRRGAAGQLRVTRLSALIYVYMYTEDWKIGIGNWNGDHYTPWGQRPGGG